MQIMYNVNWRIQWTSVGSLQALTSFSTFADTRNIFSRVLRVQPNAQPRSRLFVFTFLQIR